MLLLDDTDKNNSKSRLLARIKRMKRIINNYYRLAINLINPLNRT